jgi:uncharacterized HAD superfamily protein
MVALHLNCALTDVDGLLRGQLFRYGTSRKHVSRNITTIAEAKTVLVLDDSAYSGEQIAAARQRLRELGQGRLLIFAVVYASPAAVNKVDFYFSLCPIPRMFEWNIMHHIGLKNACIDIDGVICHDPTDAENDDGPRYLAFLADAKPLFLPTVPIGYLVTSRLEKYRKETEAWLARYSVKYQQLIMMDLPSKEARIKSGGHGSFKARVCKEIGAPLFIESDECQALEIANGACVDVFCFGTRSFIRPSQARERINAIARGPLRIKLAIKRVMCAAKRKLGG